MTKLLSSLSWTLSRKKEKFFLVSNCVRFQKQIRDQLAQQKRDFLVRFKSRDLVLITLARRTSLIIACLCF